MRWCPALSPVPMDCSMCARYKYLLTYLLVCKVFWEISWLFWASSFKSINLPTPTVVPSGAKSGIYGRNRLALSRTVYMWWIGCRPTNTWETRGGAEFKASSRRTDTFGDELNSRSMTESINNVIVLHTVLRQTHARVPMWCGVAY